jgi:membrane protein YdbS with pleckstrin-like domain
MTDEFEPLNSLGTRVDLRELYPISARMILARSFWVLAAMLVAATGYILFVSSLSTAIDAETLNRGTQEILELILVATIIASCIRIVYEVIYFFWYSYTIELEHITVTRGVLVRSRSSIPIARINDASLIRTPIDLIFGIYSLTFLSASPVKEYLIINGLNRTNAVNLQAHLLALVETTLPNVKEGQAEKALESSHLSPEIADRIIHEKLPEEDADDDGGADAIKGGDDQEQDHSGDSQGQAVR